MEYYVVKSGMQMYDLSRAYGLGVVLQKLSGSEVKVKDFGYYYLIDVQTECMVKKIDRSASLLPEVDNKKWDYLFLTLKSSQKKDTEIRNCKNLIINKNLISRILAKFKNIKQPEFFGSRGSTTKTLYESLDLSATKGFRERIRGRRYHRGTQLFVPIEDFILSIAGHLNFTIWKWYKKKSQLIVILFTPSIDGIQIGVSPDARDITKHIDEYLIAHRAGFLPTLSYAATLLAKEISQIKGGERSLKFSNLIFGVMVGAGEQSKPYRGGVYPLDFLYKIINSTTIAGEIFDRWSHIFKLSNMPGYEHLALYLSEFITYPSEESLEKYLRVHLKTYLSEEIKPKLYEHEIMKEVIKNA